MAKNTTEVYLSLGSNMGDRMAHLSSAKEKLMNHPKINISEESKIYETEPWPQNHPEKEEGQLWFLNSVIKVKTGLNPDELLLFIQSVESDLGRTEKGHWGSREIDIDILLYGQEVIESDHLTIPHRHMTDRHFVLVPLVELSPELKDPVSGKAYKTILQSLSDKHKVIPFF